MTLLSSALHWNYIKTLTQTKKTPSKTWFYHLAKCVITLKLCVPGGGIPAAHYRTTCAVSQRRARDGRRSCPMFYSAFDSWRGPSGWTQREYQKGKIKKKRVDGLFSQCRRAADTLKSHAACVARTKRSARTWKLLRLTPPTNGFQQLTSPLHHLGQTLKFLAKPWNTEGKKKEKKTATNLCLALACASLCTRACSDWKRPSETIFHVAHTRFIVFAERDAASDIKCNQMAQL